MEDRRDTEQHAGHLAHVGTIVSPQAPGKSVANKRHFHYYDASAVAQDARGDCVQLFHDRRKLLSGGLELQNIWNDNV